MRSRPPSSAMSRPSKAILPAVGCSVFKISLAVVVLPHPDSPMSPSVSPAWMAKSTPSTAFTRVAPRPTSPCRAGKCFTSPRTSRTGSAMEPASGDASVGEAEVPRLVGRAAGQDVGAARMEVTTGRQVGKVGRLARDRIQRLLVAELRHRADQGARVRVLGSVEELPHRRLLDDLARVHHGDPVTHLRDDTQVVRDEDQGHADLTLDVLEEIEILRL